MWDFNIEENCTKKSHMAFLFLWTLKGISREKLFLGTRELLQDDGIQTISFQIMILDIIKIFPPIHPMLLVSICQHLYEIHQRQRLESWEAVSKGSLMRHSEKDLCSRPWMSPCRLQQSPPQPQPQSSPFFSACHWAPETSGDSRV